MKKFLITAITLIPILACLSGCNRYHSIIDGPTDAAVNAEAQTLTYHTERSFDISCLYYSTDKDGVEVYDTTIDDGVSNKEEYDYTGPWFTISTGNNRRTITITLQENTSGIERSFRAQLESGKSYQWLSIRQSPR